MKLDVRRPESWDKACDLYRRALGLNDSDPQSVQVFLTIDQALREVCSELSAIYVHRKTVFFEKDLGPEFEETAVWFSKNEFQVKSLSRAQLTSETALAPSLGAANATVSSSTSQTSTADAATALPEAKKNSAEVETSIDDPHGWIEASAKDLLLVVSQFDDAVTGELIDSSVLEPRFKDKRFFRIRISHSMHLFKILPRPNPYEIWILSLGENTQGEPRVLAISGERGRTRPPIASILPWSEADTQAIDLANGSGGMSLAKTDFTPEQQPATVDSRMRAIQKFESEVATLLPGAKPYFSLPHTQGLARLPHAAVFFFDDIDGSAFADLLLEKITALPDSSYAGAISNTLKLNPHELVSTSSLCRWQSPRLFAHLLRQGLAQNQLRGLILLDPVVFTIKNIESILVSTLSEIRQLQG